MPLLLHSYSESTTYFLTAKSPYISAVSTAWHTYQTARAVAVEASVGGSEERMRQLYVTARATARRESLGEGNSGLQISLLEEGEITEEDPTEGGGGEEAATEAETTEKQTRNTEQESAQEENNDETEGLGTPDAYNAMEGNTATAGEADKAATDAKATADKATADAKF